MIGKQLGNYTIRSEIGRGGMGIVYEAYDHSLQRRVALKVIPAYLARQPDIISRFRKEARAAAKLSHPAIVEIYGIGREEDTHFFVMEYLEGTSLEKILEEESRLPCPVSLKIIDQVAGALELAHRKGFIHRDIKPSNIMFNRRTGLLKVTDFGIAKALEEDSQLTASDARIGTPRYMSPEQVRGEDLDPRTDLFSLGVVLFQMLTGKTPFRGDSFLVIMRNIIEQPPEYPPGTEAAIPEKVRVILNRLLAKEPGRRYQTAGELKQDIKNFQSGKELSSPGKGLTPASRDIARLIILAAVVGTLIYLLVRIHPVPPQPPPLPRLPLISAPRSSTPIQHERDKKARNLFLKAEDLLRRNPEESEPAAALFREVVDEFPGTPWSDQAGERLRELNYKKRFDQGMDAMIKQNWQGAAIAFEEAQAARDTADVKKQLARARLYRLLAAGETFAREGKIGRALKSYRDALKLDPGRAETAQVIARLEEQKEAAAPAAIALLIKPPEASIFLDGNYRGRAADFDNLTAIPGRHTIKIQSPGHLPESKILDLTGGEKYSLSVILKPHPKEKKNHRVIPVSVF